MCVCVCGTVLVYNPIESNQHHHHHIMIALLPARPLGSLPVFYDQEEVYMIEKKLPEDLYPFFWYFPIPVFGAD